MSTLHKNIRNGICSVHYNEGEMSTVRLRLLLSSLRLTDRVSVGVNIRPPSRLGSTYPGSGHEKGIVV